MQIVTSSEMDVTLVRHMADDEYVVQAAHVSSTGITREGTDPARLINALMKGRHGSPFEHAVFTFYCGIPIFVAREFFRHRIGSFNEMSGRYTTLPGKFYIPAEDRGVINVGTPMKPRFEIDRSRFNEVRSTLLSASKESWAYYNTLLDRGIANEVSRMGLPLNIYTEFQWTVNARSLMNFLSLRVESEEATFKSYPQYEIQMTALLIEEEFKKVMPHTYAAFIENGRVAP